MNEALAPFFGIGVPSAAADAYPGTPPWAVALIWLVIALLTCGGLLLLKTLHEEPHGTNPETQDENSA